MNRDMTIGTIFFLWIYRMGNYLVFRRKLKIVIFPVYMIISIIYRVLQVIYGCSIPFSSTIGKNICFKHGLYGIFISGKAVILDNVTIMHQVTIGSNFGSSGPIKAPLIGNNVFIGPASKIIGDIKIHDNSKLGVGCILAKRGEYSGVFIAKQSEKLETLIKGDQ